MKVSRGFVNTHTEGELDKILRERERERERERGRERKRERRERERGIGKENYDEEMN